MTKNNMRTDSFAKISARNFPTPADIRLVVESFHYAKFGERITEEYHGYSNRTIYSCSSHHDPPLEVVELKLKQLAHTKNNMLYISNDKQYC